MINYQRFFLACDKELRRPAFVGRRPTCLRPKAEDTSDFLRLDRNRKPRMKRVWH